MNSTAGMPVDVVIVPDFAGAKGRLFELRSLFFLAFWMEYAGRCRDYPVHLACIGEPPASVQRLAAQANAHISVHQPMQANEGLTMNKVRGFEVKGQTDHLLLLDTDIQVLGDISDLAPFRNCVAAAQAFRERVSEQQWRSLYDLLGMRLPTERVVFARKSTKIDHDQSQPNLTAFPYYNSGVVLSPWDCELPELWVEYARALAEHYAGRSKREIGSIIKSDQAAFAVAVEQLKQRGRCFRSLPDTYHGHWQHLSSGELTLAKIKLFHATSMFKPVEHRLDTSRQVLKLGPSWLYRNLRWELTKQVRWQRMLHPQNYPTHFRIIRENLKLTYMRQTLYNKYIVPVLD